MNPCQQDDADNHWLAAETQAAIDDQRPSIPHEEVMAEMEAEIAWLKEGNPTKNTAQQTPVFLRSGEDEYSLDVVEMLDGLMQGADRDLVKVWQKMNAKRFDNIMRNTKTVGAKATPEGIEVTFESA